MLTLLVAFSPLLLAYVEIALLRRLLHARPPRSVPVSTEDARDHLTRVLAAAGVTAEVLGHEGSAPIELICRDARPLVGGRIIVHARLPQGDREASAADVLILADRVWRARGIRGLLVASDFSDQARTAARAATQSVELVGWRDLAIGSPSGFEAHAG